MNTYRLGFVMEQHLGLGTHSQNVRVALESYPQVVPTWVEVTYAPSGGLLERLPFLSQPLRGALRGASQVRKGLAGKQMDGLMFFTHKPAVFHRALLRQAPTLLSLDVTPRQYDELGAYYDHQADGDSLLAWYKHRINQEVFHLAHAIVPWSNWVKTSLVQDYGVAEDKLVVIPPGVDLDLWQPTRGRQPATLPLKLLFVGGDFKRKGGEELLRWFAQYGQERCSLHIVTKALLPPMKGVYTYTNLTANSPQLRQLYRECDLFVLPSKSECFGVAYLEALASGLPVIATKSGGTADIVEDGLNGFRIEPQIDDLAKTLEIFLERPELCRKMGWAARTVAEERFNVTTTTDRLIQVFCGIVERKKSQSLQQPQLLSRR